jgi:glycosyltransferase involved in cell wall biosynthesis
MRIAWFTPFSPRSTIGHYSAAVLGELAREHAVVVFAPAGPDGDGPRPTDFPLVRLPDTPPPDLLAALAEFDAVVYHLGNYPPYHLPIYETAVRFPGVVVLHDLVLRDFFLDYATRVARRPDQYPAMLRYAHGPDAEVHGWEVIGGRAAEVINDPRRLDWPLFLPALRGAVGAVTHSAYARGRVAGAGGVPVAQLDFPLFGPARELADLSHRPAPADGPVRLLTFGMLNANKLIHATIEAIARSRVLRSRVRFEVIGGGGDEYRAELRELVRRHRLEQVVHLAGWQPDDRLRAALVAADVVVNLRNPHTGESSASLLDSLVAGVPTVVWDHGSYAEFPDDVVVKVKSEGELGPALERLVADPAAREAMGRAAREHAVRRFDTATYCRGLVRFLERTAAVRQFAPLADRVTNLLREMGCTAEDETVRRIGRQLDDWAGRTTPYSGTPPGPPG